MVIATELVIVVHPKIEKRSVRLLTSCVETVIEKDIFELFASPGQNPQVNPMKPNQLKKPQLLWMIVLIAATSTSIPLVRVG